MGPKPRQPKAASPGTPKRERPGRERRRRPEEKVRVAPVELEESEEASAEEAVVAQEKSEESDNENEKTSAASSDPKDPSTSSKTAPKKQRKGEETPEEKPKEKGKEKEREKDKEKDREKEKEKEKEKCQEPVGATVYQIEARYLVYRNLKLCGGVRVILNCQKEEGYIQLISLANEVIVSFDVTAICFLESNSAAGSSWCGYPLIGSKQDKGEEEQEGEKGGNQGEEDACEEFKRHQRERCAGKKGQKVEFAQVIFCTPEQMQRFRTVVETVKCALDCPEHVQMPEVGLETQCPYESNTSTFTCCPGQQTSRQDAMPCGPQQGMYPPNAPSSCFCPSVGYGPQQYAQGPRQQEPQSDAMPPGNMPGQQQYYDSSPVQRFGAPQAGNEYPGAYGNMPPQPQQMYGPTSPPRGPPGTQPEEQYPAIPPICQFQKGPRQNTANRPNCNWEPIKDPCPTSCCDNDGGGPIPFDPCPSGPMVANLPPCLPCDMGDPYSFSKTESRVIFCTPACLKISRNDNDPCPMICRGKLKILECAAGLGFSLRLESAEGHLLFGHSLRRNLVLGPTDEADFGYSYITVVCRARKTSLEHVVLSFPSEYQMEQFANAVEDCKRILGMTSAHNLTRNVLC